MLKHCAGVCSQFWERQKSRGRECESNFEVGREQQKSRKRDRHRPGCFSVEQLCGSWKRSCDDILGHISYNTSENERGNTRYPGTQEGHRSCAQSVEQKKRHRCIEQSFRLCGRRRGWDVSREEHRNVYYLGWNRSPAQVGCMRQALRPGALGRPRGIGWRGRWEGGSGWGTHVNPWLFHFNVWQNPLQYKKLKKKRIIVYTL